MQKNVYTPVRGFKSKDRNVLGFTVPSIDKGDFDRLYNATMRVVGHTFFRKEDSYNDVLKLSNGKRECRYTVKPGKDCTVKYYVPISECEVIAVGRAVTCGKALYFGCITVCIATVFAAIFVLLGLIVKAIPEREDAVIAGTEEEHNMEVYYPAEQEADDSEPTQTGSKVKDLGLLDIADSKTGSAETSAANSDNSGEQSETPLSSELSVIPAEGKESADNNGSSEGDWLDPDDFPESVSKEEVADSYEAYSDVLLPPVAMNSVCDNENKSVTLSNTNVHTAVSIKFMDVLDNELKLMPGESKSITVVGKVAAGTHDIPYTCEYFASDGATIQKTEHTLHVTVKQ